MRNPLLVAASRFSINMNALRVFAGKFGKLAEQHDDEAARQFAGNLGYRLGLTDEEIAGLSISALPPEGDAELQGDDEPIPRDRGALIEAQPGSLATALARGLERAGDDPEMATGLAFELRRFMEAAPVQGEILRQSALITLVSYLDVLISQTLHAFYMKYPDALPADDHKLTLAELRLLGSIEDAQAYIRDRIVEGVMRDSLDAQLQVLERRHGLDLQALSCVRNELVEITQRRHLLVHNGGVVNRLYLSKVTPALAEQYAVAEGELASVSTSYLEEAMDHVSLAAHAIIHTAWAKWFPEDRKSAETSLVASIYEALTEQRYPLVTRMAELAGALKPDDARTKLVAINHAIALKCMDRRDEMEEVLARHDWSAAALAFKIALHALRDERAECLQLIPLALAAKELTGEAMREWPLFGGLRDDDEFVALIPEQPKTGLPACGHRSPTAESTGRSEYQEPPTLLSGTLQEPAGASSPPPSG